ncbi:MAG TPA: succinylglutamate desuccinylase/aspartoacylase family protein [Nitrososphaerales archaeon]|nr:succinylglutamate desuccinylase/aspartoacylase family protein [Nitrososphaerales archaeon]
MQAKGFGVEPRKTLQETIIASEMPGANLEIPFTIVSGSKPGPTLAVTAGIHGSEYCAIVAAHKLAKELSPNDLNGTVAIVPLVTRSAFENRTRWVNPMDGVNPNRAFPGKLEGSISYQIAYHIFNEVISKSDAYVDMHGGDLMESLTPHALFNETGRSEVDQISEKMATSFGVKYVWRIPKEERGTGNAFTEASFAGIPSMLSEVGEDGKLDSDNVRIQYDGILNVMRVLGILEGGAGPKSTPMVSNRGKFLTTKRGGVFYAYTKTGDVVRQDQLIGEIKSLGGETLEEIRAPFDSVVLAIVNNPAVKKSDITFEILSVQPSDN